MQLYTFEMACNIEEVQETEIIVYKRLLNGTTRQLQKTQSRCRGRQSTQNYVKQLMRTKENVVNKLS